MRRRTRLDWLAAAALALAAAGCDARAAEDASRGDATLQVAQLPTPAGQGSAQPSLASADDERVILTWHEPAEGGAALRMATLDETGWSAPVTVAAGRDFIVNWADFPSALPLGDGRLAVHWLEREGSDAYAYGVRLAFSNDGGATWSEPIRPHTDSTQTERGFVSLLPAGDGVRAVWLDGRNFAAARPEMTLRSAVVSEAGLTEEALLDARICDCCQTDATVSAAGEVVVYRDRTEEEIRDISIVRRVDGQWTAPEVVHADGWHIDGCPVNGPAVASRDGLVAVAWFTAARDTAKVLLAVSQDGGASFAAPIRIDGGDPAGRVDVVLLEDRTALVSWIEETGDAAELRVSAVTPDGRTDPGVRVAAVSAARSSGFARMAVTRGGAVIAWTDVDGATVRVARLSR